MTVRIINADVFEGLKSLPDDSVHCVVTSPPYWGLRDYGVEGQIGLEPSLGEHLDRMVEVFREVRRVLRPEGTCWLNYGDCYATSPNGRSAADTKAVGNDDRTFRDKPFSTIGPILQDKPGDDKRSVGGKEGYRPGNSMRAVAGGVLKPKDLVGMPWRLAFALHDDGWWLRQDIIWSKPNPMPESVRDRCTKAHEYVFMLTKSAQYFYDAEAIKEFATYPDGPNSPDKIKSPYGQGYERRASDIGAKGNANGFRGGSYVGGKPGPRTSRGNTKPDKQRGHSRRHAGFNERWDQMPREEQRGSRNKRSVWTIATAPFPEAHFATFPPELPELCIKAGCPKDGTVLDPFGGAGTTGLVADRLQRNAILIELNPEYAEMAENRINKDRGGLLDVMEGAA